MWALAVCVGASWFALARAGSVRFGVRCRVCSCWFGCVRLVMVVAMVVQPVLGVRSLEWRDRRINRDHGGAGRDALLSSTKNTATALTSSKTTTKRPVDGFVSVSSARAPIDVGRKLEFQASLVLIGWARLLSSRFSAFSVPFLSNIGFLSVSSGFCQFLSN